MRLADADQLNQSNLMKPAMPEGDHVVAETEINAARSSLVEDSER